MPGLNVRQYAERVRAENEPDEKKRLQLLRAFVAKYPDNVETRIALEYLFSLTDDLPEKERMFARLARLDEQNPDHRLNMAAAYVHANTKLPQALMLLDDADKFLEQGHSTGIAQGPVAKIFIPEETYSYLKGQSVRLRAEILWRMGKPREVIALLQPLRPKLERSESFFLLGQAYEQTGDMRGAVDAYLEAVVRPSKEDRQHNEALARLWRKGHFGNDQQLERRIDALRQANFGKANYVPRLTDSPAPAFDVVMLKGEQLSSASLSGRKVVLNFWAPWCAPCVLEMPGLQEYQRKHPEVVVLAVVGPGSSDQEIARVVRSRRLETLRIGKVTQQVVDRFGVMGVPHTFVIDEAGRIRVHHYGDLIDVERFLDADTKAIDAAPAAPKTASTRSAEP